MIPLLLLCCLAAAWCPSLAVQYRAFRVLRGEQANLTCWEAASAGVVQQWVTPSDGVVNPTYLADDDKKYQFDWDGSGGLRIWDATKDDSGVYKCMQLGNNGYFITYTTLQVIDVTYLPELDDWQSNLARGLISAACMAAFFIISCAVHKYRWRNHQDDDQDCCTPDDDNSRRGSSVRRRLNGIDNPAAQFEETKEIDTGF